MEAASRMKSGTAAGPDLIEVEILKYFVKVQPESMLGIFNKCLKEGRFPDR